MALLVALGLVNDGDTKKNHGGNNHKMRTREKHRDKRHSQAEGKGRWKGKDKPGPTGPTGPSCPSDPMLDIIPFHGDLFPVDSGNVGSGFAMCPIGSTAISAGLIPNNNGCFPTKIHRFTDRRYDVTVRCPIDTGGAMVRVQVVCIAFT